MVPISRGEIRKTSGRTVRNGICVEILWGHGTDASSPNRFVPKGSGPVTREKTAKAPGDERFFSRKNLLKQLLKQRQKRNLKEEFSPAKFKPKLPAQYHQFGQQKKRYNCTVFQPFSSDLHHSTSW